MTAVHDGQQPNLSYSEDDDPPESSKNAVKRGTRACDRCRKIKSKCEPSSTSDKCKNCEVANTLCTFQGPSFKRGPPKGYIHSIEQRWHQVECILATIMESPRAQDIINDLRSDSFANAILDRVQSGPYGSQSRLRGRDPTNENFYSSLMEVPEHTPVRDDRRSRRQSRVSREIVSQDPTATTTPTREWQEQLARVLRGNTWPYATSPISPTSRSSSSAGGSTDFARTRRVDWSVNAPLQQNWDNLYRMPEGLQGNNEISNLDETAEAFGHLSVDHNKEFRYHGPASGLPLLAQSRRKTGDVLQENRIWKFTEDVDPEVSAHDLIDDEEDVDVRMPSAEEQGYLLQLYFTWVHPFIPVIHKQDFLNRYHDEYNKSAPPGPSTRNQLNRHPMQRPCKMLLLAMFANAARFSARPEDHQVHNRSSVSKAGQQYAEDAHKLLDKKYQSSRPSTCQALLLLAIREFGMGAMDKGWLYSGMALRMAIDLGMNRNPDSWTTDGRQSIFTDVEKQIRRRIWWSCCVLDKLSAVWLGRPITFRANDYSTPKPDINKDEEDESWQPYPQGSLSPQPARLVSCFREMCNLSVIITDIMDKIYPVQQSSETPRRVLFEELETRLNKWIIQLPEHLRYPPHGQHTNILPHVLMLHIEYHAAVLLLHRAFLPDYDENNQHSHANLQGDPLALKAFDVCAGAAVQICALAEFYHEKFGLARAPAFLCIYLQSAGIMHVITLTRRPWDPQATLGLSRCIEACKNLESLWPTAKRLRMLLEGAKVRLDETIYSHDPNNAGGRKRTVDDALGPEQNPDVAGRDAYTTGGFSGPSPSTTTAAWVPTHHARSLAHTLGFEPSGVEASSTYYPGFQWWPNQLLTTEGLTHMALSAPMDLPPMSAPMHHYGSSIPYTQAPQHVPVSAPLPPHYQHVPTSEGYTFGQGQVSQPDFMSGTNVNYPHFDFSRSPHPTGHQRQDPQGHQ